MALTRREFLERLAAAYAGAVMSSCSRQRDRFAQERVCIHVLHPREFIPAPLLEKRDLQPRRSPTQDYFNIGLPELAICETPTRLLDLFQYFWPFSRDDFEVLQKTIAIRYQKQSLNTALEVREFAGYLREHMSSAARAGAHWAVLFTWNDFSCQWSAEIAEACQEAGVEEFVVFKNPAEPPYLCDYPAKQKGFKRPPVAARRARPQPA